MSVWRIVWRSLGHYWRTNAFIVLGVLVATAVMTGSMLVGDSMTASLRQNVLARLGAVDDVLITPHFFPATLGARVAGSAGLAGKAGGGRCATVLMTRGVARPAERENAGTNVAVMGVDEEYWRMFPGARVGPLGAGKAAVSQSLAEDLHLQVGGEMVLSVDRAGTVADEILFAKRRREDTVRVMRLTVAAVVADGQGGDFGMEAGSVGATAPRNVFVGRDYLGTALQRAGEANEILLQAEGASAQEIRAALVREMGLADYGLTLVKSEEGGGAGCLALESSALLLTDNQIASAKAAAREAGGAAFEMSAYLATRVAVEKPEASSQKAEEIRKQTDMAGGARAAQGKAPVREIAYAIVSVVPEGAALTMKAGTEKDLPADGAIVNAWAASDLGAKVGDGLELTYLVPTPAGAYVEEKVALKVAGIVELTGAAADRHLTPGLNGLTDAKRIDEWKLPFPVDNKRLTDRDEAYWEQYGATPKVFVASAVMQGIWKKAVTGGATGWVTGMRLVPGAGMGLEEFDARMQGEGPQVGHAQRGPFPAGQWHPGEGALLKHLSPERNFMVFRGIREQMLASAAGSTDFGELFFSMSFFLIVAAAALAGMLMRLLVEQRAGEIGTLLACGWRRRQVRWLVLGEGMALTAIGVVLGVPAGVGYNRAMLGVMDRWWMGPWGHPVLRAQVSAAALGYGAMGGLVVGMLCAVWGLRALSKTTPLQLLSGRQSLEMVPGKGRGAWGAAVVLAMVAVGMLIAAGLHAVAAEVGFFVGGAGLLAAMLLGLAAAFATLMRRPGVMVSLGRLSVRNAGASRRRSLLTVGLLASACFILVAVAANGRDYSRLDTTDRHSGAGGFVLRATTAVPVHFDLWSAAGRARLGISPEEEKALAPAEIFGLMESPGDDVSCLNLAKPMRPRLLGVTRVLAAWGAFPVEFLDRSEPDPWSLLLRKPDADGAIPAFGDADSVEWILHSGLGKIYEFPGPDGLPVKLKIVGVIPGSIFAGELLVGEENLQRIFPGLNGWSYFLVRPRGGAMKEQWNQAAVMDALRSGLADQGVEVRSTREILNRYVSVQNVYLSIFMSLGGLGLMLGTAGMVAVIARSVLERRGELALMAAAGFRRGLLVRLVALEHVLLLVCGVVLGSACALLAVVPVLGSGRAQVQWSGLGLTLGMVGIVGLAACTMTARFSIGARPVDALREE